MKSKTMKLIRLRLRNQLGLSKLSDNDISAKTHAMITNIGYLTAFVLVLGYVVTLPYQMNQLEMVNPYIFSLLFWVFGIWTLLSGVKNVLVGFDHDQIFVLPIEEWQAKLFEYFFPDYDADCTLCDGSVCSSNPNVSDASVSIDKFACCRNLRRYYAFTGCRD
ncbi:hypothetical protein ACUIAK_14450 [Bacillus cytotoxicus]